MTECEIVPVEILGKVEGYCRTHKVDVKDGEACGESVGAGSNQGIAKGIDSSNIIWVERLEGIYPRKCISRDGWIVQGQCYINIEFDIGHPGIKNIRYIDGGSNFRKGSHWMRLPENRRYFISGISMGTIKVTAE